jgi:hypothetical protein
MTRQANTQNPLGRRRDHLNLDEFKLGHVASNPVRCHTNQAIELASGSTRKASCSGACPRCEAGILVPLEPLGYASVP